jgi:transcription termination factor Rho
LAERYIYPAFDIERSGTRRQELMLDPETEARLWTMRRMIDALGGGFEAIEPILERLTSVKTNAQFLNLLSKDIVF